MTSNTDGSSGDSGSTSTTNGTAGNRAMMSDEHAASGTTTLRFRNLPTDFATGGVRIYLYSWSKDDASASGGDRYAGVYRFRLDPDGDGPTAAADAAFMRNYNTASGDQDWPGFVNNQAATQGAVTGYSSYAVLTLPGGFDGAAGFDVAIDNLNSASREMIQGVQLELIPEPATFALSALGLALLLPRRRPAA